jgi:hypothetical protein
MKCNTSTLRIRGENFTVSLMITIIPDNDRIKIDSLTKKQLVVQKIGKGKFIPVSAMKAYGDIRRMAPLILNLITRWR